MSRAVPSQPDINMMLLDTQDLSLHLTTPIVHHLHHKLLRLPLVKRCLSEALPHLMQASQPAFGASSSAFGAGLATSQPSAFAGETLLCFHSTLAITRTWLSQMPGQGPGPVLVAWLSVSTCDKHRPEAQACMHLSTGGEPGHGSGPALLNAMQTHRRLWGSLILQLWLQHASLWAADACLWSCQHTCLRSYLHPFLWLWRRCAPCCAGCPACLVAVLSPTPTQSPHAHHAPHLFLLVQYGPRHSLLAV